MKPTIIAVVIVAMSAIPVCAQTGKPYKVELVARPTAPFPFLKKFGEIDITLYPGGVAGESLFLRGFSRNGEETVTLVNPLGRMYVPMTLSKLRDTFVSMSGRKGEIMPGLSEFPVTKIGQGNVRNVPATRYRVQLGPESSMDVWTTAVIPKSRQFEVIYLRLVDAVSHSAVATMRKIPGTPIYIEMNTLKYKKLPLLSLKSYSATNEGEKEALEVGSFYIKAPILESMLD